MKEMENGSVKQARFEADLMELEKVSDFVKETLRDAGCRKELYRQMDVVVEEIFVNIASYAYAQDAAERPVIVECGREGDRAYLAFRDKGASYNPLEQEDPELGAAEKMAVGGYGIFMVKTIMDEIQYAYEENENVLRMWKKLDDSSK